MRLRADAGVELTLTVQAVSALRPTGAVRFFFVVDEIWLEVCWRRR